MTRQSERAGVCRCEGKCTAQAWFGSSSRLEHCAAGKVLSARGSRRRFDSGTMKARHGTKSVRMKAEHRTAVRIAQAARGKRGCHSLVCGFTCAVEKRKFRLQRLVRLPVSLPAFPGKNWAQVYAWRCRDGSGRCGREWKQRVQRTVSGSFREAKGKCSPAVAFTSGAFFLGSSCCKVGKRAARVTNVTVRLSEKEAPRAAVCCAHFRICLEKGGT